MINNPVIVGCGTLGATLALNLAKRKLISELTIYDFDIISSGSNESIYPFSLCEVGMLKVEVLKFICNKINPDLVISAYEKQVLQPLDTLGFIIDCRDCKVPKINSKLKLSLDGHLLYIDSSKNYSNGKNYYRYIYSKNPDFIETATNTIIDYLINDEYFYPQLRLYDIKKSEKHILYSEV